MHQSQLGHLQQILFPTLKFLEVELKLKWLDMCNFIKIN